MLRRISSLLALAFAGTGAGGAGAEDLLDLPLEQLLNMEISTASRFPQKRMDAPAAVTVITAEDIKDYGYRTLADVMRSIRGVYMNYDRNFEYFGARGFGRSGDYNSRLLLMLDGRRLNETFYDQAFIGTDGIIDLENVARIEFVPGSASALYGSNAFFGVMNVITKQGKDLQGGEIAGGFGSYGADREKVATGYRFDNGADVLLSASRQRVAGHSSLAFDRLDAPGIAPFTAHNLDGDKTDRLFGKFGYQGFELEGAFSGRNKIIPTASFFSDLDSPQNYDDRNGFAEARYEKAVTERFTVSAKSNWSFHDSYSRVYYGGEPKYFKLENEWWGTEVKSLLNLGAHKLVLGSEYQSNFVQHMFVFNGSPYAPLLNIDRTSHRYGFYLQDEFAITSRLALNAGARYDYYSIFGHTANPRVGLIYAPWSDVAFKLIYGTAFRPPNMLERFFQGATITLPDRLKPENIESVEGIVEFQATKNLRLTATAFHNDVTDLINLIPDSAHPGKLVYTNNQRVTMQGLELESEYRWSNGTRLRGSYAFSYAKDAIAGGWLENSPKHLAKLNFSLPLWRDRLRAGTELQSVGDRKTKASQAPGYALVNLTLTAARMLPGLEISASLYNLLDKRYVAVAGNETVIDQIPQDGRNFRLWFSYRF